MNKADFKRTYLDNSLMLGWFLPIMRCEKPHTPKIVEFLQEHQTEIEVFVSKFTIAELMETLLHHEKGIKPHMKNPETVLSLFETLRNMLNIKVIVHTGKKDLEGNPLEGNFITADIIDFTVLCKQPKDAIHIAIAKYEDCVFLTHDTKATVISKLYKKTSTDNHMYKIFKEN